VNQTNETSFELNSVLRRKSHGTEHLPKDDLWSVCDDKERNTCSETVTFFEHLVQHNDDQTSHHELGDNQEHVSEWHGARISIGSIPDLTDCLTEAENESQSFFETFKGFLVMSRIGSHEPNRLNELDHPSSRNDRRDTELHERASTGSKNNSGPVEGIAGVWSLNSVKWNLRTD